MPILMVDKDNKDVDVDENDFDDAISSGLEPAFEMKTPDGKDVVVRKSDFNDAQKSGLKPRGVAEAQAAPRQVGKIESAARGFANSATFGFPDEISAGVRNPIGAAKSLAGLVGVDMSKDADVAAYAKARDEYRTEDDAAYDQNKAAYILGGVVPVAAQTLGAGAGKLVGGKAASAFGGSAALQGGVMGAAQSAGGGTNAQADLTKGQGLDLASNTLVGGLTGSAFGKAMDVGGKAAVKGIDNLKNTLAYRATGGLKSDINKLYKATPQQVGEQLLESGSIGAFTKRGGDELAENLTENLSKFGSMQDKFLAQADAAGKGGVKASDVYKKILTQIEDLRTKPGAKNEALANALEKEMTSFVNKTPGDINFTEAVKLKRGYDAAGKFDVRTDANSTEAARIMRRAIKDASDESLSGVVSPESLTKYKGDRRQAKLLLDAQAAMGEAQKREAANKFGSLTDMVVLGPGAAAAFSNPMTAVGTAGILLTKKLAERYGDATGAVLLNAISKSVKKNPMAYGKFGTLLKAAAARGPAQLQATHNKLAETDPEYLQVIEQEAK